MISMNGESLPDCQCVGRLETPSALQKTVVLGRRASTWLNWPEFLCERWHLLTSRGSLAMEYSAPPVWSQLRSFSEGFVVFSPVLPPQSKKHEVDNVSGSIPRLQLWSRLGIGGWVTLKWRGPLLLQVSDAHLHQDTWFTAHHEAWWKANQRGHQDWNRTWVTTAFYI